MISIKNFIPGPDTEQFRFPSTGKVLGKVGANLLNRRFGSRFQFPSNGKVHEKSLCAEKRKAQGKKVSIPFKREGTWKVTPTRTPTTVAISFNSLQTGRYMERELKAVVSERIDSFNSLQTGRYMESLLRGRASPDGSRRVSIPFKREGTWKVDSMGSRSGRHNS